MILAATDIDSAYQWYSRFMYLTGLPNANLIMAQRMALAPRPNTLLSRIL